MGLAQPHELRPPREQVSRALADPRALEADEDHSPTPSGRLRPLRPDPAHSSQTPPTQILSEWTFTSILATGLGLRGSTARFHPETCLRRTGHGPRPWSHCCSHALPLHPRGAVPGPGVL